MVKQQRPLSSKSFVCALVCMMQAFLLQGCLDSRNFMNSQALLEEGWAGYDNTSITKRKKKVVKKAEARRFCYRTLGQIDCYTAALPDRTSDLVMMAENEENNPETLTASVAGQSSPPPAKGSQSLPAPPSPALKIITVGSSPQIQEPPRYIASMPNKIYH